MATLAAHRPQEQHMTARKHAVRRLPLVLACALLCAPFAQAADGGRIEQQMSYEEFRAAGLDQLDAGQLANLNRWLERNRAANPAAAVAPMPADTRGMARQAPSREPVNAQLVGSFDGFSQGRNYRLDNGQVWRQTDGATLSGVQIDNPAVRVAPSLMGSAWYLQVEGYNTRAKVERVE